jgi:SAM-dependent methyltransferase
MPSNFNIQEPIFSVKAKELIEKYKRLGVDITSLVGTIPEFHLHRNADGLMHWQPAVMGDSEFYGQLAAANDWYYLKEKAEYAYAATWITNHGLNLEVGCGEGHFAQIYKIQNYTGLEINDAAVKWAHQAGINVQRADFHQFATNFPASAKRLFSFQFVEHLSDPYAYFKSAHRVLSDGGFLITAVPAEDSFLSLHQDDPLNCPPHHMTKWTDQCLKRLPETFGFQFVDLHHVPVESVHHTWFLETFLEQVFLARRLGHPEMKLSKKQRIALALLKKIKGLLISAATLPPDFHIPGHTVVAVHKKI